MISHIQQTSGSCYVHVFLPTSSTMYDKPTPSVSTCPICSVFKGLACDPHFTGPLFLASTPCFRTPIFTVPSHLLFHLLSPIKMNCFYDPIPSMMEILVPTFVLPGIVNVYSKMPIQRLRISNRVIGECWSNLRPNLTAPITLHPINPLHLSLRKILGKHTAGMAGSLVRLTLYSKCFSRSYKPHL